MQDKPLFSVIIPAYNGEKTLEKAVESLRGQAPEEGLEILIVDDASTDGTEALCRRLAAGHDDLFYFKKENGGPAAARNFALPHVRGEWILFCDCDDYFFPASLAGVFSLAKEKTAELLIFGYALVSGEEALPYLPGGDYSLTPENAPEKLPELYAKNQLNQVWGKAFSKELLTRAELTFPDYRFGEDRLFLFRALRAAKGIAVTDKTAYAYVQQKGSLVSRFLPEKARICREIDENVQALFRDFGADSPESRRLLNYMYIKSLLSSFVPLFSQSCPLSYREKRAFLKEAMRKEYVGGRFDFPAGSGRSFAILAGVMKTRNITLNYLSSFGVFLLSEKMPGLFRRAKHAYNRK